MTKKPQQGLFRTAAVLTDIHFGKKSDSPTFNNDCTEFVRWFCEQAAERNADRIIFIGDWFDNQSRIRLDTLHAGNTAMDMLRQVAPVELVVGNHDMFFRDNRTITSVSHYAEWENIRVHNQVGTVEGVGFVPYLIGAEYLEVQEVQAQYVFGHFELPTFLMNGSIEARDRGGLNMDHFTQTHMVFSGHFHKRQTKTNGSRVPIWYVGSPFGHDFNDVDDTQRGMMMLDWDGEPEFIDYDKGPLYQRFTSSRLVDLIENDKLAETTRNASILEIRDDLGLELEDQALIRDAALEVVREVRMQPSRIEAVEIEADITDMEEQPLEDTVAELLLQVDPRESEINPKRLVELFKRN